MKIIKILGTGCPSCISTEKIVSEAVKEANVNAEIIKADDIQEIMAYDVLSTPAVVIDEVVVIKGKVPTKEEVKMFLSADEPCCKPEDPCCEASNDSNCC